MSHGVDRRENQATLIVGGGIKLSGEASWNQQFRALAAARSGADEDFSFRESSVKDVSDNTRMKGASKLQRVLEEVVERAPPPRSKAKASGASAGGAGPKVCWLGDFEVPEAEVRHEVRALLKQLQTLRASGPGGGRNASIVDCLKQLAQLPVNVDMLKATKVAAELNGEFWKGPQVGPEVRERSAALVRQWRATYRSESGKGEKVSKWAMGRKCRSLAMDLEENAYGKHQKIDKYGGIVDLLCRYIERDTEAVQGLMTGAVLAKDLAQKAAFELKVREQQRLKKALREKLAK